MDVRNETDTEQPLKSSF